MIFVFLFSAGFLQVDIYIYGFAEILQEDKIRRPFGDCLSHKENERDLWTRWGFAVVMLASPHNRHSDVILLCSL